MSDYLFSSVEQPQGRLSGLIKDIYFDCAPDCTEFHGSWGSLAVSKSHYHGFMPYEDEQHLCVVIGAPVLYFRNNDFLTQADSSQGTKAIYMRWTNQRMSWTDDISGPFTVLLINKQNHEVSIVTDLMAFIPVYSCLNSSGLFLGTHVDALAHAANEQADLDKVSLADFILNDVVTFPYTAYTSLRQELPGSITRYSVGHKKTVSTYWQPIEQKGFSTIDEAALTLRQGIKKYINTVTKNMSNIAQFISAGEDSRALSGMLPQDKPRDAYIFLDSMNREGRIAKKVAKAYDVNFTVGYRDPLHYLDIQPAASALVGLGHQYAHAHSLTFDKQFDLPKYDAVFGGFLSDTLLKGHHVATYRSLFRLPFLPQIPIAHDPTNRRGKNLSAYLKLKIKVDLIARKKNRLREVREIRPQSAEEWFNLYPCIMHNDMPNIYTTRRLFKSYEPFLSHEVVKVAAQVPTQWKLNRRLFHKAMKPFLRQSQWVFHADGRLPYYPWWFNIPIQASIWTTHQLIRRISSHSIHQGPWADYRAVFRSKLWQEKLERLKPMNKAIGIFDCINLAEIEQAARPSQKLNLLQTLQHFKANRS